MVAGDNGMAVLPGDIMPSYVLALRCLATHGQAMHQACSCLRPSWSTQPAD